MRANILIGGRAAIIPSEAKVRTDQFGTQRTGKLVPISGVRDSTHAFIPDPLPPQWEWPGRLWPLLLDARTALASLDGAGRHLPNPALILRPLQNREAQRSSRLEGTYTEPSQQALFDLNPTYPDSASDPVNDRREVFNYARALRHRRDNRSSLPLSLRLIREFHRILMDGVRGADSDPGEFRRTQNQIGRPARFVPPPPDQLLPQLDLLERQLHAPRAYDPLVDAFLVHYQFEAIHPFMDGNGRVGRLLLAVLIEEWCGLSDQWLYMSAYFDANRDRYLDLLLKVSTDGVWSEWIDFCLTGVAETAKDTLQRCEQLIALHRDFHDRLRRSPGSVRLAAIVDDLFINPVALPGRLAEKHGVTYPTARADLTRLHKAGIIQPFPGHSQIAFICPRILQITYAD